MKTTDLELAVSKLEVPAFVRNIAQKAISELKSAEVSTSPIILQDWEFDALCRAIRVEPKNGRVYRWIRIYDELDNSIDIQTERSFIQSIVVPLTSTFANKN